MQEPPPSSDRRPAAPPTPPERDGAALRLSRRALAGWVLLAVLAWVLQVAPHVDAASTSFPGYWVVAREIAAGTPAVQLYDHAWLAARMESHGFVADRMLGPPTLALTLVPLAWLPYPAARLCWLLLMLGALVGALFLLTRTLPRRWRLPFAAAWLLSRPAEAGFEVGQVYPAMLLLHALASRGWARNRAAAFALPTALLVLARGWYGLPQSLGALLAGRVRFPLLAAALTVTGLLLTLPLLGGAAWRHFLTVGLGEAGGGGTALVTAYQTWRSLALRLTTEVLPHAPDPPLPGPGPLPWLLGAAVLLCLTAWAARPHPPGRGALGFALWTGAAVLLAPVAEDHHMVLAALPAAALLSAGGPTRWLLLPAGLLLLPAWDYTRPALWGGWRILLAYPRVWGLLLLQLGLVWAARRPSPLPAPRPSPSG